MSDKFPEAISPGLTTVLTFFREELQPVVADLQLLAEDVAGFRVSEALYRRVLQDEGELV